MSAQPIYTHRQITYRLRPGSRDKATKLFQQAGACRKVWNETLAKNQEQMELHRENPEEFEKPSTSFMSMGVGFTKLRKELDWLQDYSASITRYTLKYQADA
ncbi:MAG: helix-turn-helix domain-containing protein [Gammaproteobacteria bacterium]|nr:helix-turn-helix domain-containing protein [Gammaproteobacteria bacterium]